MLYLLLQWGPATFDLGVGLGSLLMAQATMGASLWAWSQLKRDSNSTGPRIDT